MKTLPFILAAILLMVLTINVPAAVRYVDLNSTNPTPPYADWSTAATNIQDAVDAAADGDEVLVTNGVYQAGGKGLTSLTNRVEVTNLLALKSVNGPSVTFIAGNQVPGTINDFGAVRCVYLAGGATLSGFTLTNGATEPGNNDGIYESHGGGVYCASIYSTVTNCIFINNSAGDAGGGATGGTLNNCMLNGNSSGYGGGAEESQLINCTITNNSATAGGWGGGGGVIFCTLVGCTLEANISDNGGGAYGNQYNPCILNNCVLTGNWSGGSGGGANGCILSNCTCTANVAVLAGGAAYGGTLDNCILTNNTVSNPSFYWTTSGGGAFGGTLNNCLLVMNSAFGGGGAEQCVLNNSVLTGNLALWGGGADGSQLTNCTVTGNSAQSGAGSYNSTLDHCTVAGNLGQYGGGAEFCGLTDCILATNTTYDDEVYGLGGGADGSTLNNCLLYGNVSSTSAGASASTLNNCTVVSNVTTQAGGAVDSCTLYNSIVYYNITPDGTNCSNSILTNCCIFPLPDIGTGNITNAPLFIYPETNNFRLQHDSPCINAGNNAYVSGATDLDGNPRIVGGTVDIGACEYQTPSSVISYAWLQQYGLTNDGSADFADTDGDGMNNWQEWRTGTSPTDPSSLLKLTTVANDVSGIMVTWQSVEGVTYFLQRSTDLGAQPAFSTIQTDIAGQPGTTSYTDTDATGAGPYFYRVGVQ
jgi:hypothetical protein